MSIERDLRALGFTVEGTLEAEAELARFAHEVCEHAQSLAPVFGETGHDEKRDAPPHGEPEDYKNSIKAVPFRPGHWHVGSDDYKAIWIEFGSVHMPEYAVFAKTAAYYGGTGPVVDEGVMQAHHKLRLAVETLAKLAAAEGLKEPRSERAMSLQGSTSHELAEAQENARQARMARSSAFRVARGGGRGRGRNR